MCTGLLGRKSKTDFSSTTKYLWNATVNNWRVPTKADMQVGKVYRQMETGDFTKTFTGIPNGIPIT
jgi:hypothetical protein